MPPRPPLLVCSTSGESGEPSGFNDNSPDDSGDNPPAILADCGELAALFSAPPISVMEVHFNLKGPSAG